MEEKYAELLEYGNELGMYDMSTWVENGKLFITGTMTYQMDKHLFWDKIKTYDDWETEIAANITYENTEIFGIYTVQPGDSLSKIAKKHMGDPMRYMEIFDLNTDILNNPNNIQVGQNLRLPILAK